MHEEIENVVGSNRQATLTDKTDLPYCNAVITETQRLGNIVPLSLFHMATEDLVLENRRIPKGAIVIPVLDSVQNDEKNFPNPEKFDPTRFINNEGKYCNQDKIMPFSLGMYSTRHKGSYIKLIVTIVQPCFDSVYLLLFWVLDTCPDS